MKRLIASLILCALPFSASASPDLARDWGMRASTLYQETVGLLESDGDLSDVPENGNQNLTDPIKNRTWRYRPNAVARFRQN